MKKNILSTLVLTAVFAVVIIGTTTLTESGTMSAYANTGGSPGGRTGSPGDNSNCTACHSGTINSGLGVASIASTIPASGYVPGQTYTITGTIFQNLINKFGFEISSERDLDNSKTGTIVVTNSTSTKLVNGNNAITHKLAGTTGTNTRSWNFDWVAPVTATGNVTFYGAFNCANGTGTSGDKIYSTSLNVVEDVSVGIDDYASLLEIKLYPNPVENYFQISSDKKIKGIELYNMKGQKIRAERGSNGIVDVEQLPSGIYFVQIEIEGKIITKKMIKK
ncbi:MAG: hypothetical protein COB15_15630 [Flavobacteriales bacterium]|nr:MAG: hypothetical protein COB15_15630 [Flavobacteriales bacterium]